MIPKFQSPPPWLRPPYVESTPASHDVNVFAGFPFTLRARDFFGKVEDPLFLHDFDTLVFEFGRLSGPVVEAQHAVSYDVDSTMRISVPLGSVAWVPPQCPRRLRVHASVCLEVRGSPLAIAREVWGLRSAALWASVHLTRSVSWLTPEAKRQMRAKAGYELVEFQKLCLRLV